MVLAVEVIDGKAAGDPLLVVGLRLTWSVGLRGLILSLGPGHEFDAHQRQQIAQFAGVEEKRGDECAFAASLAVAHGHGPNAVAGHVGANRVVYKKDLQTPARAVRVRVRSVKTTSATRGSWHNLDTLPLPGLRWRIRAGPQASCDSAGDNNRGFPHGPPCMTRLCQIVRSRGARLGERPVT